MHNLFTTDVGGKGPDGNKRFLLLRYRLLLAQHMMINEAVLICKLLDNSTHVFGNGLYRVGRKYR